MGKTYRAYLPEQDLLLPPSLRDWLPDDHLAYFVSDVVEQLGARGVGHDLSHAQHSEVIPALLWIEENKKGHS
jgi:hypothetical protein